MHPHPPPDLSLAPDGAVIARILDGSAEACRELHRRYEVTVFHAIFRRIGDPDDAHDLTLKTFEKVYGNLKKYDSTRPLAPWILRIAENTATDHYRKEKREALARQGWLNQTSDGWRLKQGIPAKEPDSSDQRIDVQRLNQEFARAREQVNRTYLECFRLHYVEDRSYAEIAKKLHLTEATARSYAHRAGRKLEMMLGKLRHYLLANTPP